MHVEPINRNGLCSKAAAARSASRSRPPRTWPQSAAARLVLFCVKIHRHRGRRRGRWRRICARTPSSSACRTASTTSSASARHADNQVIPAAGLCRRRDDRRRDACGTPAAAIWSSAQPPQSARTTRRPARGLATDRRAFRQRPASPVQDFRQTSRSSSWTKLVMNCAYNAISRADRTRHYGRMVATPAGRASVMRDVVDRGAPRWRAPRASASARRRSAEAVLQARRGHARGRMSSTAQDLANAASRTEIDHLNGYVVRQGEALGMPTPVNRTLQRADEAAGADPGRLSWRPLKLGRYADLRLDFALVLAAGAAAVFGCLALPPRSGI